MRPACTIKSVASASAGRRSQCPTLVSAHFEDEDGTVLEEYAAEQVA
jgi:hypothetical protein